MNKKVNLRLLGFINANERDTVVAVMNYIGTCKYTAIAIASI